MCDLFSGVFLFSFGIRVILALFRRVGKYTLLFKGLEEFV